MKTGFRFVVKIDRASGEVVSVNRLRDLTYHGKPSDLETVVVIAPDAESAWTMAELKFQSRRTR